MRNVLVLLVALVVFLAASPAFAQEDYDYFEMGTFSVGLGGGFSEVDVGPIILSGKYWDTSWEIGAEAYLSTEMTFDSSEDYDQIGLVWIAYRYDLSVQEEGAPYVGIGAAGIFEDWDAFSNDFGPVAIVGWDALTWGAELKYAWFDPGIISAVAYYHFDSE